MFTSQAELSKFFSAWSANITIMQRHDDLVDKDAPARPIPMDKVNQTIFMEKLWLIESSEVCNRCGDGNKQALTGALNYFPGLPGLEPTMFLDVCIGDIESFEHFIEHRVRIQMALALQQNIYRSGYGFADVGWPRSMFDHPDEEKRMILV